MTADGPEAESTSGHLGHHRVPVSVGQLDHAQEYLPKVCGQHGQELEAHLAVVENRCGVTLWTYR